MSSQEAQLRVDESVALHHRTLHIGRCTNTLRANVMDPNSQSAHSLKAPSENPPRHTLDRRFELLSPLGEGGMGEVFLARERKSGAIFALKLLRNQLSDSLRARFMREARLASQIRHPHIIRVRSHSRSGEQLYLVMDLVKGLSLQQLLKLPIERGTLCALLIQMLGALAYIHARGILHRDIKPDNILISRTPNGLLHAWLTDFGIAGLIEDGRDRRLTDEGAMLGTPDYMAPEQARSSRQLTANVDLYPIGVILYHFLSGQMPFVGSLWALLLAKSTKEAPLPHNLNAWPAGLWSVVRRLLVREPSRRFRSASEVIAALEPFAAAPTISLEGWQEVVEQVQGQEQTLDKEAPQGSLSNPLPNPLTSNFCTSPTLSPLQSSSQPPSGLTPSLQLSSSGLTPSLQISSSDFPSAEQSRKSSPAYSTLSFEPWDGVEGRGEVLEQLLKSARNVEEHTLQIVLLSGSMGSGLDLLSRHIGLRLAESGRFVRMHGHYMIRSAGDGLRLALERMMGTIGASPDDVKRRVKWFMEHHGSGDFREQQAIVEYLRPSIISEEAQERMQGKQRRTHHALILRFLRQLSKALPLILVLNDVHHDDADFSAFIEHAIIEASYEPISLMILATFREGDGALVLEPLKRFLLWGTIQHIVLKPLEPKFLAMVLHHNHSISFVQALEIAERSGGNPLFAQLLVQSDRPEIRRTAHSLPEQLRLLMMEQFERSLKGSDAEPLRELSIRAALLGSSVEIELLEVFSEDLDLNFDDAFDTLIRLDILVEDYETDSFRFQHPLLGESLALLVQGRRARRLHLRAARLCEEFAGARVEAQAWVIGDHHCAARNKKEAISWWMRGLEYEILTHNSLRRAIHCGTRLLEHLEETDPRVVELRMTVADLLREQGADIECVMDVLEPLRKGTPDIALPALEIIAEMQEGFPIWEETIREMEVIAASKVVSSESRRAFERAYLFWLNHTGRQGQTQRLATQYLKDDPERPDTLYILNRLFWSIVVSHSVGEEVQFDLGGLAEEIFRRETSTSDPQIQGDVIRVRALYHFRRGDVEGALRVNAEGIKLYRRTGHHARLMHIMGERVFFFLQDGRFEESKEMIAQIRQMGLDLKRDVRISIFDFVAHVLSETSPSPQLLEEIRYFIAFLEQAREVKGIFALVRSWLFQAQALLAAVRGDWDEVYQKLSVFSSFIFGWGLPSQLLAKLGALLIQHHKEVPEDEQMFKLAARYLGTSRDEWPRAFSAPDDSFISNMIDELHTVPRAY